jgi:hypothetical protein
MNSRNVRFNSCPPVRGHISHGQAISGGTQNAVTIPNLFIVGAMKSATTSLHAALNRHPDVFMSEPKEPAFFIPPAARPAELYGNACNESQCMGTYLSYFNGAKGYKYVGEASTHYTKRPLFDDSADQIAAFSPDARIIYIVRDPVERTLSHYWWNCQHYEETRNPMQAIRDIAEYCDVSNYAMQIRPYLERFSRDRVWLMTTEAFREDPASEMGSVFKWLGLDPEAAAATGALRENQTPDAVVQQRSRMLVNLRRTRPYRAIVNVLPKQLRVAARRLNERSVDRKSVPLAEVMSYLRPLQRRQTDELAEMFRRSFDEWETLYGA